MAEGQTIVIDGRDYTVLHRAGYHEDGTLWLARRDDRATAMLVGPPWRIWTPPVRSAGRPKSTDGGSAVC